MPTKPLTEPELWATNALYTTGPFIGSANKSVPPIGVAAEGHRPGSLFPTPAEYENSQQNRITALCQWVFAGTFNPDPDAHIVETDSTGRAGVHGLDVIDTVDETAVLVQGVNTLAPTVDVQCSTGAACIQATIGASSGTGFTCETGAGAAATGYLVSMASSPAGAVGIRGVADGPTNGPLLQFVHNGGGSCIEVEQAGSGVGVLSIQSGSSLAGLFTQSGGGSICALFVGGTTACIKAQGDGTGAGGNFESGITAGANAIEAVMVNNDGVGLDAATTAAASIASRAVRATARNLAIGVEATAESGEALLASASGATGVAIYCPGKAADPTNVFDGRMDWNTTTRSWVVSDQNDIAYRDIWTSRGGLALGQTTGNTATTVGGAVWVTAATLNLTGSNAPKRSGRIIVLQFRCTARSTAGIGATNTLNVRLRDTAIPLPATIVTYAGAGGGSGAGFFLQAAPATFDWIATIAFDVAYTIPSAGNRTFVAEIQTGTANNIQVRDAAILPYGLL